VGYLFNTQNGLEGLPGMMYSYILAGNGVFIQAQGPLLSVRVLVALAPVRGLAPLDEEIRLIHGLVPSSLMHLALLGFRSIKTTELYLAIVWEETGPGGSGHYALRRPFQEATPASVRYLPVPKTVVDMHSHGDLAAFFSSTDDADEQGLKLYIVAGKVHQGPIELNMRCGAYGYFAPLTWPEVFDGTPPPGIVFKGEELVAAGPKPLAGQI
jgi:PRTRC genetic system protein A